MKSEFYLMQFKRITNQAVRKTDEARLMRVEWLILWDLVEFSLQLAVGMCLNTF
jgi:hypothetical protein